MYVVIILYIFIHIGKRIYKYLSIGYDFNKFWRVGIFILSTKFQCETMLVSYSTNMSGEILIFFCKIQYGPKCHVQTQQTPQTIFVVGCYTHFSLVGLLLSNERSLVHKSSYIISRMKDDEEIIITSYIIHWSIIVFLNII